MSFNSILDIIQWYKPLANRDLLADSKARFEDAKRRKLEAIAARQQLNQIKEDKPIETDYDAIQDEREHQYRLQLQRRMARCGDSTYPAHLARQDIIEAEQERLRMMGVVDISEQEN